MLIRSNRRIPFAAVTAALAAVALLAGCAQAGTVGDLRNTSGSDNSVVGSILNPSNKPAAGSHTGHDGGLTGQQSLPSFDSAPLPRTVSAKEIQPPYANRAGAITGKLFFFRAGDSDSGNYYVCSGTVIKSKNRSLVWTAGHCVHDGKNGTWHEHMVFVPGFANNSGDTNIDPGDLSAYAPLGVFPALHVWTSPDWVKTGDEHGGDLAHDYGVIEVGRNDQGQTLDDAVETTGARPVPVWFNAPNTQSTAVSIKGYPAAQPFDGMAQWTCQLDQVQLLNVTELGPDAKEYRAGCDLTGGASGGGWFAHAPGQSAGEYSLITNTSVGSAHSSSGPTWLAGPYLDAKAQVVYDKANSSAGP